MTGPAGLGPGLVDSHWYRVAHIAPRLRTTLRLHTQRWRGRVWTVVEDRIAGKYHRFDRQALRIIRMLDGATTLERIWQRLAAEPQTETPSQQELLSLLAQLHTLDLLAADTVPDLAELGRRGARQQRRQWIARYTNPLAIRIPLLDPDRLLARWAKRLAPLFGRWGAAAWLALVLPALLLVPSHWSELSGNFAERLLAFDNVLLLVVIFPVVKALHELGHGLACKANGGEVHDMGVMLLLFLPVPYVEASSAWTFGDKRARMLVGAAGMLVELALAAVAFYLWLVLEPGLARAVCYDTAVLASVTTIVFNANPLLRYDGYYIAVDALEIPNLAQRAGRWWGYAAERFLLGRRGAVSPAQAPGEAGWFAVYAPLAFAYRLVVMVGIAVFVATQYFAAGMLIAAWSVLASFGLPLLRAARWAGRQFGERGARSRPAFVALALLAVAVVGWLPLPHSTQVDGVLWLPDSVLLRAGQSGFIRSLDVASGNIVRPGDVVARLEAPELRSERDVQAARVAAARARYEAARTEDPAAGAQYGVELGREEAALAHLDERAARLSVTSAAAGRLWQARAADLQGRYVHQGELVGYVVPAAAPRVRVIVEQGDEALIRDATRAVRLRLPLDPGTTWTAQVVRAVPAASTELPSAALGRSGGGAAATDPRDDRGRRALASHFEYELALPPDFPHGAIGSRASVRFEHAPEPIGPRLARATRRLFLAYFHA